MAITIDSSIYKTNMLRALHIIMNKQSVGWLYISLIIHLSLAYTPPPSFILTWQMNHNLILEQYWWFIIIISFIMSIIIYGTHLINIHLQTGYWLKFISFIIIVDLMLAVMRWFNSHYNYYIQDSNYLFN